MTLSFHNPVARIPTWEIHGRQRWLLDAPTGWGKSVWLKQLALLRDAESTTLSWRGKTVTPDNARSFRQSWRYLAQTPLRTSQTIAAHLDRHYRFRGLTPEEAVRRTEEIRATLAGFGLKPGDFARLTLADLSGGELQAFSLVSAVLDAPEGLLLDEPTAAMDAVLAQKVESWLLEKFTGSCIWVAA